MRSLLLNSLLMLFGVISTNVAFADGAFFAVESPRSEPSGELIYGMTYTVWIPEGVAKLRLPEQWKATQELRLIDKCQSWLALLLGSHAGEVTLFDEHLDQSL